VRGGRVLFLGFEATRLTAEERRILKRVRPAGLTLVPRNIDSGEQLVELMDDLRQLCPDAVFALDAEGGRVDRLRHVVAPAPAAASLATRPPRASGSAGRWIGGALRRCGFDLDLAPVVDLDRGATGNALDGRCFGRTPRGVTARAAAFLDGLHEAGVGACLKHFPGLGGAGRDTHADPAWIALSRRDLARDLRPFQALAPRAEAVMASHAVYPALDPAALPATLSPALATALLRRQLRYRGVLLSDDLEMGALAPHGDLVERGEAALDAGCDGLLFCRRLDAAPAIAERLARAAHRERLASSSARLDRLRRRLAALRRAAGEPPPLAAIRRRLAALSDAAVG
jgi:beta-N-acetylhexosaminidase